MVISLAGMAFLMSFAVQEVRADEGGGFVGTGGIVDDGGSSEPGPPGCDKDFDNSV